jgi:mannose-1-phosphate guanylyltransferase
MIYGVIMAGGKGERFWPLSRLERPKQFLRLTSDKSMIEETIERVRPLIPSKNVRIVAGQTMTDQILKLADFINPENMITEPFGRNTCLACGLAAWHLYHVNPEAVMIVLSTDHLIRPAEKLLKLLGAASKIASVEDCLITLGVVPTRPETGYGYIKLGELYRAQDGINAYQVLGFTEKPKLVVAQEYYHSHNYLWNSGMFAWSARTFMNAVRKYQPEMGALLDDYGSKLGTKEEEAARQKLYDNAIGISVDYAIMEKADNVLTMKADMVWDDIGSWMAVERINQKDADNNVLVGESALMDTFETTVYNDEDGIIACVGVSDLVIVRSSNITLVAHKTRVGEIKELLARLAKDDEKKKYL